MRCAFRTGVGTWHAGGQLAGSRADRTRRRGRHESRNPVRSNAMKSGFHGAGRGAFRICESDFRHSSYIRVGLPRVDAAFVSLGRVGYVTVDLICERRAGMASSRISAPLMGGADIRNPCRRLAGHLSRHASPAGPGHGGPADHWVSKLPLSGVR